MESMRPRECKYCHNPIRFEQGRWRDMWFDDVCNAHEDGSHFPAETHRPPE